MAYFRYAAVRFNTFAAVSEAPTTKSHAELTEAGCLVLLLGHSNDGHNSCGADDANKQTTTKNRIKLGKIGSQEMAVSEQSSNKCSGHSRTFG